MTNSHCRTCSIGQSFCTPCIPFGNGAFAGHTWAMPEHIPTTQAFSSAAVPMIQRYARLECASMVVSGRKARNGLKSIDSAEKKKCFFREARGFPGTSPKKTRRFQKKMRVFRVSRKWWSTTTVDGRNPFRTTWKPWETIICWYLQGNHHSRVSSEVQNFVHPQ